MKIIDLRSDTVTRPSVTMRKAMMNAGVGDDVYGEDPTINLLQDRVADMFGKEAALFVPSGTMGNEICIKCFTQPGDEIIAEEDAHVVVYETGGPGFLSGVSVRTLRGERGVLDPDDVRKAVRPPAYYLSRTRLICVENTHGRSGGSVYPARKLHGLREVADQASLPIHMDGARIWNASAASGVGLREYARYADSLSVCFSKGLGAPVGSAVIGSRGLVEDARRYRKIFGGGMRQAGILAAGALYAIEHNLDRIVEDHENAKIFAEELNQGGKISIRGDHVESNMVIFDLSGTGFTQEAFLKAIATEGILLTPERDTQARAVTHLDVTRDEVVEAARKICTLLSKRGE